MIVAGIDGTDGSTLQASLRRPNGSFKAPKAGEGDPQRPVSTALRLPSRSDEGLELLLDLEGAGIALLRNLADAPWRGSA